MDADGDEMAEMLIDRGVPFHLLPHLNRYLVRWLFAHPRDPKTGQIRIRPRRHAAQRPAPSPEEQFAARWERYGLAAHRIVMLREVWEGANRGR